MAPLVVKGKVLVGNRGGEIRRARLAHGARRRRTARSSGRAYSTGPDKDVLIGPDFKPFYEQDQGKDLGVDDLAAGCTGRSAAARSGAGSPTIPS